MSTPKRITVTPEELRQLKMIQFIEHVALYNPKYLSRDNYVGLVSRARDLLKELKEEVKG